MEELHVLKALDDHHYPLMTSEQQLRAMTPESAPSDNEDDDMSHKSRMKHTTQHVTGSIGSTCMGSTMQTIVVRDAA
jgi:hypothetical protein